MYLLIDTTERGRSFIGLHICLHHEAQDGGSDKAKQCLGCGGIKMKKRDVKSKLVIYNKTAITKTEDD